MTSDNGSKVVVVIIIVLLLVFGIGFGIKDNTIQKNEAKISKLADENIEYEEEIVSLQIENDELRKKVDKQEISIALMENDYIFYAHHAACVSENDRYYHHPDCDDFDDSYFYIYNTELAEVKGYTPCPICW